MLSLNSIGKLLLNQFRSEVFKDALDFIFLWEKDGGQVFLIITYTVAERGLKKN